MAGRGPWVLAGAGLGQRKRVVFSDAAGYHVAHGARTLHIHGRGLRSGDSGR